jgi:hypothetical protein
MAFHIEALGFGRSLNLDELALTTLYAAGRDLIMERLQFALAVIRVEVTLASNIHEYEHSDNYVARREISSDFLILVNLVTISSFYSRTVKGHSYDYLLLN